MVGISSAQVKELRERTGAGMMDCKRALGESNGSMDDAIQWLRSKGLAAAAKKAGRVAAEGLVGVSIVGNAGVIIEVNSETDFVARNKIFQELVSNIASVSIENKGDFDATANAAYPGSSSNVSQIITEMVGSIGENMQFRRSAGVEASNGYIISYIHNAIAPDLGKIGVLLALETDASADVVDGLGKQIAMHIAATNPQSISIDDLDKSIIDQERTIYTEQAKDSGKPDNIIEKMVDGRVNKFYSEVVLMEQIFVIDNENKVSNVLYNFSKENNCDISIKQFVRFSLGEGIEKRNEDFVAEVAAVKES